LEGTDTVSWVWIALLDERSGKATAAAEARDEQGEPAGFLTAWKQRAKPVRHALRADERIVDTAGEAASVSLVLAPAGVLLPFDDPGIQQARRRVLAGPPADAVSTLLRDASHFEGAITVRRGGDAAVLLRDDPFARICPARLLEVGPGVLGAVPPPAGPTIERYGSERPWPWDRFGD
jgi:hypothetical protein